jgi:hypothetical protein
MLEDLDQIRWASLEHAHGKATDTPRWLRKLATGDTRSKEEAIGALSDSLSHQGARYPATVRALPFLLEIVGAPGAELKAEILRVVVECAVGLPEDYYGSWFDLDATMRALGPGTAAAGLARNIHEAARAGIPVYARLLADPSVDVRMYAAFALAWFDDAAADAALTAHLDVEQDERARASAVWSLSMIEAMRGGGARLDRWFAEGEPLLVRFAAAVGLVRTAGAEAPPAARSFLVDRLSDPTPLLEFSIPRFPWPLDDVERLARLLWSALPADERDLLLLAMTEGLTVLDGAGASRQGVGAYLQSASVQEFALLLLEYAVPTVRWERRPDGSHVRLEERQAGDLTEMQRLVLEAIVKSDGAFAYANIFRALWERGLPGERAALAAMLNAP